MLFLLQSLAFVAGVQGHARLTSPTPREYTWSGGSNAPTYTCAGPIFGQAAGTSMRCHGSSQPGPIHTITAGGTLDVSFAVEANHPGDCAFYLSYDSDKAAPAYWVKIASLPGCVNGIRYPTDQLLTTSFPNAGKISLTLQLLAWLPPCDHCVMRWEWYTTQQVSSIEYYVNCFDVKISPNSNTCYPTPAELTYINGIDHLGECNVNSPAYYNPYVSNFNPNQARGPALWIPSGANCGVLPATTTQPPSTSQPLATNQPPPATTTQPTGQTCLAGPVENYGNCNAPDKYNCCPSGWSCYRQSKHYSQCLQVCPSSGWDCSCLGGTCSILTSSTTTTSPPTTTLSTVLAPSTTTTASPPIPSSSTTRPPSTTPISTTTQAASTSSTNNTPSTTQSPPSPVNDLVVFAHHLTTGWSLSYSWGAVTYSLQDEKLLASIPGGWQGGLYFHTLPTSTISSPTYKGLAFSVWGAVEGLLLALRTTTGEQRLNLATECISIAGSGGWTALQCFYPSFVLADGFHFFKTTAGVVSVQLDNIRLFT
eukprot:g50152.t1